MILPREKGPGEDKRTWSSDAKLGGFEFGSNLMSGGMSYKGTEQEVSQGIRRKDGKPHT